MEYASHSPGFYTEFLPYIEWISELKDSNELKEIVSTVAVNLAKNENCANKMIKLRFQVFYEKVMNDPSSCNTIRTNAKKFLRVIQRYQKKE